MIERNILVSHRQGNLLHRQIGGDQKLAAFGKAQPLQIFCKRNIQIFFEKPADIGGGIAELPADSGKRNITGVLRAEQRENFLHNRLFLQIFPKLGVIQAHQQNDQLQNQRVDHLMMPGALFLNFILNLLQVA